MTGFSRLSNLVFFCLLVVFISTAHAGDAELLIYEYYDFA
jgi:hypothetical protein